MHDVRAKIRDVRTFEVVVGKKMSVKKLKKYTLFGPDIFSIAPQMSKHHEILTVFTRSLRTNASSMPKKFSFSFTFLNLFFIRCR